MTDLIIKGKITIENSQSDKFVEDLKELLEQYNAYLCGSIISYEFDECEIIDSVEKVNN